MYSSKPLFPYANGYVLILPRGQEKRDFGKGSIVIEDDYIIYFKPDTPDEVKIRFVKEYAEHYKYLKHNHIS